MLPTSLTTLGLAAALSIGSAASAGLLQVNSVTDIGGGQFVLDIGLDTDDYTTELSGSNQAFAFNNLTFSGTTFVQQSAFGGFVTADTISDATSNQGAGGIDFLSTDTFWNDVNLLNLDGTGPLVTDFSGASQLQLSAGARPGVNAVDGINIAQIVVSGNAPISYSGLATVGSGSELPESGVLLVPEPASLALLGAGAATVLTRRRHA